MASFILPIVSGLAGLFGGQPKQQQQTNQTNSQSSGSFQQSNTPQLSDAQNKLVDYFTNDAINRWNKTSQGVDLSDYTAGGLQNINDAADLKSKIMSNTLAAKGLSFSPASAFSQAGAESDRLKQSTDFTNTLPLIQEQFQEQGFENLLKSFGALPTATSSSGSSDQTSSSTQKGTQLLPGNPIGGALSGFGAGLAAPAGGYDINGKPQGGSNLSNIMKALGLGGN